ncbi:MAG: antitoxin [Nocardioidaceae bacterium]
MGIFDKVRDTAKHAVDQHGDKITRGLDSAAKAVDKRTGHKHSDKINKGVRKAKEGLDRQRGKGGPDTPPPGTPPESGPQEPPGTGSTPPR